MISRGGYRFRQVRQMTYFPFNRHNFMRLNASNKCPLGNCDNKYKMIDYCLGLGLWLSASLIRFHGNSSDQKIFSWCFLEKKNWGSKASLSNNINNQRNWICRILVPPSYKFWRIRVFITSAEHAFLLRSKRLLKTFAPENKYFKS